MLFLALVTTIALMFIVRIPRFISDSPRKISISKKDGIYDLTNINDIEKSVIELVPGTTYYPNTYLTPQNFNTVTPVSTEFYDKLNAEYLSQKFTLKLSDNSDVYALTFMLSGRHAMRIYVNGKIVGQTGTLGTTKEKTEVWENNITCYAAPKDGEMEIILNSAQFYHFKRGASLAKLSIVKTYPEINSGVSSQSKGFIIMGVLFCATLILLCMFLLQPSSKATLYFAIACLVMLLRECLQSQAWINFKVSGNLSFMLEYMSVVLLTVFLSLYLGQYITNRHLRGFQYVAIIGSCFYGICLIITDSIFYTSILKYYQGLLVVCIIGGISGLFWQMRYPTKEQTAALYGIAVFFFAAVSDILMYSNLLGETYPNKPISEMAMLFFWVAQIVSLFVANNRMVVETKAVEQKLAMENQTLECLNRMKTEFLGNVSHELKTPLTVVSGYAQTARQEVEKLGEVDKVSIAHKMKLISAEAERLSLMVSQILDITRIEEGRMVMEKVPCHLDEIIYKAIDTHYPILNKNQNQLQIRIDSSISSIIADPIRISQVIINLISNAVRFTVKGKIIITAKEEDFHIIICVSDTGVGISSEKFPCIFERYNSKEKSGNGKTTGTGLGLYICKHIVEEHQGCIWVESEEGKGTSVFFTLPSNQS